MSGLAHQPDCLHPAEDLFDALAFLLAHGVTGMTSGSAVDGTGAICVVLRDVRGDIHAPALMNEVFRVVVLVTAEGSRAPDLADHHKGSFTFRRSGGLGDAGVDDQPVAVLDLGVSHVNQLGLMPSGLAVKASLWVRRGLVRLLGSFLPAEVHRRIARIIRRRRLAGRLLLEALLSCPSLD